jgi:hypothetical protein
MRFISRRFPYCEKALCCLRSRPYTPLKCPLMARFAALTRSRLRYPVNRRTALEALQPGDLIALRRHDLLQFQYLAQQFHKPSFQLGTQRSDGLAGGGMPQPNRTRPSRGKRENQGYPGVMPRLRPRFMRFWCKLSRGHNRTCKWSRFTQPPAPHSKQRAYFYL